MSQNEYIINDAKQTLEENEESCLCEKKQCMLGIASIAIGIGGFVISSLL
ncbi:MAG: hypothetical protein KC444_07085 [Nitrosopumilus sp.]|nr:hypothetical protein [Nitrosopumilus sp.]